MSEETVAKKKRTPRPTNLTRSTAYTTTDGKVYLDKKEANRAQKTLDLLATFEANPIAEGVEAAELFEYVKLYRKEFFAVLRSLGKEGE